MTQDVQFKIWSPSIKLSCVDKTATYLINPDDFIDKLTLTPYTIFYNGGVLVSIAGLRLYMLLTMQPHVQEVKTEKIKRRSKKNICLQKEKSIIDMLKKFKTPPCIDKILGDMKSNSARGGMYRKRFILNCYIGSVVSCVKCQNRCLIDAMTQFYNHDSKCVGEIMHLFVKCEEIYKPPNCNKMKTVDKLCPYDGKCKGLNPICNY
ncbi:lef-2 [Palpita vitrealis nucleopolyhedrovirus]|uniref:Lef-2 n=1 Tax=Palpita vitrealis nucleopolyhedrovirus TaxID=2951960 RepID=A0AAE9LNM7_9ABAC|nr:lef-2 [Palpita vitrealis nucleopolyhedrovirus]